MALTLATSIKFAIFAETIMQDNSSQHTNKLLDSIDSPSDLRQLPVSALPQLCSELRDFLISALSENPGHFASSMGAVEIAVALHYVFDTPYDRIVWDVGHQAYAHKLLTGRRDRFASNRTLNGISGFPSPDESEYDTFTAGHASNSISAALGMAVATKLKGESPTRHVVAVTGDASISGGLSFEGLNNAANTPNNLLIILNDNNMSIDRNVGSLHSYLAHINTSKNYNSLRYKTYNFLRRHGLIADKGRGAVLRLNNALKSFFGGEQNIFEGLDIRYFGPFDGHDVGKIIRVLKEIKDMEGPKILHLRTTKGKGYAPAEADPANWHAPGIFDKETGKRKSSPKEGKPLKYQDVFGQTLLELARENDKITGITAAMPSGTSMSVMQAEMPDRVFDVGISEGHAVTFAGGLAKDGMRPVAAIYSSFLQRAVDNIIHDVAIQSLPVVFAIDRAGIVGEDGVTHHGLYDMSLLRTVPNLILSAPRNEHWLRNLLKTSLAQEEAPFAIRYPRGSGRMVDWRNEMTTVPIGKGEIITDPDDAQAIVISAGTIADNVSQALEKLKEEGISVAHYDAVFIKPLDGQMLQHAADRRLPIVTVEDGAIKGGFGGAVAEWFADKGIDVRLMRLGVSDEFVRHGTVAQLHAQQGIDAQGIHKSIKDILKP